MSGQWVDFAAVKQAVTILDVLQHYQIGGLKQHGDELRGRCPIHKGQGQDSFHANMEKNCFHCFSCNRSGNVLDFVAAMEGCDVRGAGARLQEWFGLQVGKVSGASSAPAAKLATEESVGEGSTLEDANGKEKEPNKPLGFELQGIVHDYIYLDKRGISKETAETFDVGLFLGKGMMSGRVVIPIHNQAGELLAYAGRSIDGTEPRYKLPTGFHKSLELYNLHRVTSEETEYLLPSIWAANFVYRGLVVVEGFFDCMKVYQAGYPWVVALMGCSMSEKQSELLALNADRVLLMLDGDEAGRQGTEKIMGRLGWRMWAKAIRLPDGVQPDQMSNEELRALLKTPA